MPTWEQLIFIGENLNDIVNQKMFNKRRIILKDTVARPKIDCRI